MAPKPRITLEDRGKIVALSEEGYTQRVIAARVGCTQASVSGIFKKKMVYGNVKDVKIPGRKRKTSQKEDRIVVRKSNGTETVGRDKTCDKSSLYFTMAVCLFFYLVIFT